jgi:hypothetical protein
MDKRIQDIIDDKDAIIEALRAELAMSRVTMKDCADTCDALREQVQLKDAAIEDALDWMGDRRPDSKWPYDLAVNAVIDRLSSALRATAPSDGGSEGEGRNG